MRCQKIDFVDEVTLMRKENDRLKKRLDKIDALFNEAQGIVDLVKLELIDINRNVEILNFNVRNTRIANDGNSM